MNTTTKPQRSKLIITLSIAIPIAVAILLGIKIEGYDFHFLPPIYATINGITAVVLLCALYAIRLKKMLLHKRLMTFAITLSVAFLLLYIAYHITSNSTEFGGTGAIKYLYYTILISHIVLSLVVIPLVLFAFTFALDSNFVSHKKWVRFAFPVWLYVAITGVIVYLMISPYYVL